MQHYLVEKKMIVTLPGTRQNMEVTVLDRVRGAILICGQEEVGDFYMVADAAGNVFKVMPENLVKIKP